MTKFSDSSSPSSSSSRRSAADSASTVAEDAQRTRRSPRTPWRAGRVRGVLAAAAVGSVVSAVALPQLGNSTEEEAHEPLIAAEPTAPASFTSATAGDCLMWDSDSGSAADLRVVPCTEAHRFEVAGVVDLSAYPESDLSSEAPNPSDDRYATVRNEICAPLVHRYTDGHLDPSGRFSVGLIQPGREGWEAGDHTVACGVEEKSADGQNQVSNQPIGTVDQSVTYPDGTCLGLSENRRSTTGPVPCDQPHALEIVSTLDLSQRFPEGRPTDEELNDYLEKTCVPAAERFLGGPDNLRNSTLTPLWGTISPESWHAGSRMVACSLATTGKGQEAGVFATLQGSAKGEFTIDGKAPVPPAPLPPQNSGQLPDESNDPLLNNSVPGG